MNHDKFSLSRAVRDLSMASRAVILHLAVVAAYLLVSPLAWNLGGEQGLIASAVAAAICLMGATIALVVAQAVRGLPQTNVALYAGMLPRMGVPLFASLWLQNLGGPLLEAGVLYYLVGFYFITLFVEIWLTLPTKNNLPLNTVLPTNQPTDSVARKS